jgi:hypothetical protein
VKLGRKRPYEAAGRPRVLVPFSGELDPIVLEAAIRIARAEEAVLVPAYLLLLPLELGPESPATAEVEVAMPLLEAVEQAALRAGVPVDARIERGRTPTHALSRLWGVERFDRVVVPAGRRSGFSEEDLAWILTHAPSETMILKPGVGA